MPYELSEFEDFGESLRVWTPDGYTEGPRFISVQKKFPGMPLGQAILEARQSVSEQYVLTSAQWHKARGIAQKRLRSMEADMLLGAAERTSTVLGYVNGRLKRHGGCAYFDGLLAERPEVGSDGRILMDGGVMMAESVVEMPLPVEDCCIARMPRMFDRLIDALYGTEDARLVLPPYAHMAVVTDRETPSGYRSVMRSRMTGRSPFAVGFGCHRGFRPSDEEIRLESEAATQGWPHRGPAIAFHGPGRCVDISAIWHPEYGAGGIAYRTAAAIH